MKQKEFRFAKSKKRKSSRIIAVAGISLATGGLMSSHSVYAAMEKQMQSENTAVTADQITLKDQSAEKIAPAQADTTSNVQKAEKAEKTLDSSSTKNNATEGTSKETVEKTGESVAVNDGTTTKTETYAHHKITIENHDEEPTEEEKKANLNEKGQEPYIKHVKTTNDESWTEQKITITRTEKTADGESAMTNADNYSAKKVYTISSNGDAADTTETQSQKAKAFLDSQNVTSNFAVYANSLDGTIGHEDGNIAVSTLNKSTTLMNKDNQYAHNINTGKTQAEIDRAYAENGYSYIGSVKAGKSVTSSSNFQKDGKNSSLVIYGKNEGNTSKDTDGTANHFSSVYLKDGEIPDEYKTRTANLNDVMKIDENLNNMAKTGQDAINSFKNDLSDIENPRAVNNALKSGKFGKDDVISVTVSSSILKNDGHAGDYNEINNLLTGLINNNTNHANVLINVDVRADDLTNNTLSNLGSMMNGISGYDGKAAYLTWNFGNFDGTINIGNTFSGNIIAPKATLNVTGVESGRTVANSVSHGGEIHMAVKGTTNTVYKTVTKTENKTAESEHKTDTKDDVTYDYKDVTDDSKNEKPTQPTDDTKKDDHKGENEKPTQPIDDTKKDDHKNENVKPGQPTDDTKKEDHKDENEKPTQPTDDTKKDNQKNENKKPDQPKKTVKKHTNNEQTETGKKEISQYNNKNSKNGTSVTTATEDSDEENQNTKQVTNQKNKPTSESDKSANSAYKNSKNADSAENGTDDISSGKAAKENSVNTPQTGDSTSIIGYISSLISSSGILGGLHFLKKRRKEKLR